MARLASRLAVVGAGRMAEAICGGMMKGALLEPAALHIYDTNRGRVELFQQRWPGANTHESSSSAVAGADVVLLAVKPQQMASALALVRSTISPSALVVSIAAGCPISMFTEALPKVPAIVRSMPNTPAMIGQGMTVWAATDGCSERQREQAKLLLGCFGDEMFVDDERYLDMATALVGSGPAYVYLLIEAWVDTGVHMGFPRDVSERLVLQTVQGSTSLLEQSDKHVAALRNDITSPGGTTAAAIYSADQGGFRTTVADAIWAAYRRSLELGGKDSNVGPGRSRK
jgi:pyrroline-5-carboxylate reductase